MFDRVPLPDWLAPYREKMAEFVREHLPDSDTAMPLAKQVGQTALRLFGDMVYVVLIPILAFLFITRTARRCATASSAGPPRAATRRCGSHRRRPRQASAATSVRC